MEKEKSTVTPTADEGPGDFELTGLPLYLVIAGVAIAIFLMSLDSSIIATAIPYITTEFGSTNDIGWYGSAYSFAMHLRTRIVAVRDAVNSSMLIFGRAIAGAGAAGCFTGGFCIVAAAVPLEKRPIYIGIIQSTFGIATIIGPVLGGVFTQHATWRWCFWINLPLGAVTSLVLICFFRLPSRQAGPSTTVLQRLLRLDLIGVLLFVPCILMILLALQWGGTTYAWKSATIIGLLVGGAALGLVFAFWQRRTGDDAMFPPRIVTERTMSLACLVEFFAMGAVYTSIYYLPEWFQVVKDATPTSSGVMYLPLALADVLAAIATGASLKYLGYSNPYIILGTALMSVGTGLMSTLTPSAGQQYWIPYQVLQGLGAGMTLSMPYVATQTILKPEDIAVGTSTLQCVQFWGAAVFLAAAQSIFTNSLEARLAASDFTAKEIQDILAAGSLEVRNVVSGSQLSAVVDAYNHGITRTFYIAASVAAVACLVSLGLPWKSIKPPKTQASSPEDAKAT
ncbi:hypothetical protein G7054_g7741 [Neopestalotiopsis clavispora]|nr:hypothetical protein G7054_g7741 [Neopestalotiopsis clavispora]